MATWPSLDITLLLARSNIHVQDNEQKLHPTSYLQTQGRATVAKRRHLGLREWPPPGPAPLGEPTSLICQSNSKPPHELSAGQRSKRARQNFLSCIRKDPNKTCARKRAREREAKERNKSPPRRSHEPYSQPYLHLAANPILCRLSEHRPSTLSTRKQVSR
ncbi:hypothetical protein BKA81DRAFT_79723 [Phyllosticta paracitricarpa]